MKRVYLDQNVYVAMLKGERPGLHGHIEALKRGGKLTFPYSPAHIEEVAVILREYDDPEDPEPAHRLVAFNLWMIGNVSDWWELLPAVGGIGPTRYLQEEPQVCWKRVIADYDITLAAEENERYLMSFKSAESFNLVQAEFGTALRAGPGVALFPDRQVELGAESKRVSGLNEEKLFDDKAVLAGLEQKLWNYPDWKGGNLPKGDALLASHKTRELVVNLVLKHLEEIGYRADEFEKYRSRMHDVTHAIYSVAADIFVTGDKRFRARVKAAYHFLGILTRVVSIDDFEKWDGVRPL